MPFYFPRNHAFLLPKKLFLFTFQETMPLPFPRNPMPLHFQNLFNLHIVCYLVFFLKDNKNKTLFLEPF